MPCDTSPVRARGGGEHYRKGVSELHPTSAQQPASDVPASDAPADSSVADQVVELSTAAQLSSFAELSAGATLAAEPTTRIAISRLAVAQFTAVERGVAQITDGGGSLSQVKSAVRELFDSFHRNTRAQNLRQLLVKAWLCAGMAQDVSHLLAQRLDPTTQAGVEDLLASQRQVSWFAEQHLGGLIGTDTEVTDRLSLFARRVVGEAAAQAQRLAAERPDLFAELTSHPAGSVDEVRASTQLIADLVELSAQRMLTLGLQP